MAAYEYDTGLSCLTIVWWLVKTAAAVFGLWWVYSTHVDVRAIRDALPPQPEPKVTITVPSQHDKPVELLWDDPLPQGAR